MSARSTVAETAAGEVARLKKMLSDCMAKGRNCPTCKQVRGRLRAMGELRATVAPEHRALSYGRLATDFEGMVRGAGVARAAEAIEEAIPGFGKAWKAAESRARRAREKPRRFSKTLSKTASKSRAAAPRLTDRALRSQLTEKRAAGLVGAK